MCLQIYEITDKCPNHKPDIHLWETQKQQLETKRGSRRTIIRQEEHAKDYFCGRHTW